MNTISFLLSILRWPLKLGLGGGGGGSGSNVTEWKPLAELQPYHQQVVQQAADLAAMPYNPYPYNRVADFNDTQLEGLQYAADLSKSGSPATAAAGNMTLNTLTGGYKNPFSTQQTAMAANPVTGQQTQTGTNPMAGMWSNSYTNEFTGLNNPYLRGMISSGQQELGDQYRYAVAPNTNAMYAMGNAYGGSAHLEQQKMQQDQLLKAMQGVESQYGNQAYQQSANLRESEIARRMAGEQSDLSRNAGLYENAINRDVSTQQTDLARNAGLYENAINRGVSAQQADRASASQGWEAERARQMASVPNALGLYQNDLGAAKTLTGVGDALQQQEQSIYDDLANEWARGQAYPQTQLDSFLNTLIRASGGFGTNTATQTQSNSINPASALLGGGLLGYSMLGK
jgi:hypothetical protein